MKPLPTGLVYLTRFTACSTLLLIFAGGMVTSTDSGLAVPDWPLSYGMLMPPMVGGIFYEHGHRMIASFVGLLTLIQAVWIFAAEPRPWVRKLALGALAAVMTQGLLGGLTVLYLLPTPVSVAHACLAQTFFGLSLWLAWACSPGWDAAPEGPAATPPAIRAPLVCMAAIWLQLLLGALMRHTGAGLAIPDFPLALGRLVPPFEAPGVAIHFAHRVGALVVTLLVLAHGVVQHRQGSGARLRRGATLGLVLVSVQVTLGAATVLTGKDPVVASLHVATGAALLGLFVLLSLEAWRNRIRG